MDIDIHSLRRIGKYEVERFVAEGGMAWVFKVLDPDLFNAHRALKLLKPSAAEGSDFQRFMNEAEVLAKIQHPNLVRVYDFGQDEESGLHFYTMDFIDGEVLSDLTIGDPEEEEDYDEDEEDDPHYEPESDSEQTQMGHKIPAASTSQFSVADSQSSRTVHSVLEVCGYFSDVLSALSRLHREQIIHRDIKPQNIYLTADGVAILGDLGIAKLGTASGVTQMGMVPGTPLYMSPEQALGTDVAAQSDLFSMGLSMFRVLTGHSVYRDAMGEESSNSNAVLRHLWSLQGNNHEFEFNFPDDVPDGIQDVVIKACRLNVEERYPTAAAMNDALKEAIADAAVVRGGSISKSVVGTIAAVAAAVLAIALYFVLDREEPGGDAARALQTTTLEMQERARVAIEFAAENVEGISRDVIDDVRDDFEDANEDAASGKSDISSGKYEFATRMFGHAQAGYTEICQQLIGGGIERAATSSVTRARGKAQSVHTSARKFVTKEWDEIQHLLSTLDGEMPPSGCGRLEALTQRIALSSDLESKSSALLLHLESAIQATYHSVLARARGARERAFELRTERGGQSEMISLAETELDVALRLEENGDFLNALESAERAEVQFGRAAGIRSVFEASAATVKVLDDLEEQGLPLGGLRIKMQKADRTRDEGEHELAIASYGEIQRQAKTVFEDAGRTIALRSEAQVARQQALKFGLSPNSLANEDSSFESASAHLRAGEFAPAEKLYRDLAVRYAEALELGRTRRAEEARKTTAEQEQLAKERAFEEQRLAADAERRTQEEQHARQEALRLAAEDASLWADEERARAVIRAEGTSRNYARALEVDGK